MKWLYGYNTTTSSADSNNFGSHAPGIIKSIHMLETQFGNLHASPPSSDNNNMNDVINNNKMMLNTSSVYAHPSLLGGSSSNSQHPPSEANNIVATNGDEVRASNSTNMKRKKEDILDDGRIHSLPHNKHGPYTCSECNKVIATSQKFAAHVSSHYKTESEKERRKRYLSRIRKRPDLQIQKLDDGTTTLVPVIASIDQSHAPSVSYDNPNMSAPAPPLSGVKVKLEPADN